MYWILGALFVIVILALVVARARQRETADPVTLLGHAPAPISPHASTAPDATEKVWGKRLVVTDPSACQTARILNGQCFRLNETPSLPLKNCNNNACRCVFAPVTERRSGTERRQGLERRDMARFDAPPDRRAGKNRRKDDQYSWHTTI
jgi:hypothetical protein